MKTIISIILFFLIVPSALAEESSPYSLFPASYSIKVVTKDYHLNMRPLSDKAIMRVTKDILINVKTNKEFYSYFRKMEIIDNGQVIYQQAVEIESYQDPAVELADCEILKGKSNDYFAYSFDSSAGSSEHDIRYQVIRIIKKADKYEVIKFKELLPSMIPDNAVFPNDYYEVPSYDLDEGKYLTVGSYDDGSFAITNSRLEFTNTEIKETDEELGIIVRYQMSDRMKEAGSIKIYPLYDYLNPTTIPITEKSKIEVLGCKHRDGNPYSQDLSIHVRIDGHEGWITDIDYALKLGFH